MELQFSIPQHGFHSDRDGFRLLVKNSYYRGVPLSIIEGFQLVIDGVQFAYDNMKVEIGGRVYTPAELEMEGDIYWDWLEPAVLHVAHPGGLAPGLHDISLVLLLRISYMPFSPSPYFAKEQVMLMDTASGPAPKLSVSLYSYNGDLQSGTMSLEDCLADIADLGADGVEFLGSSIIPNFPNPPAAWIDNWHRLLDRYKLKAVAFDTGCDTKLYKHRKLEVKEFCDYLGTEMDLAQRMGCTVFRGVGSAWPAALGVESNISADTPWEPGRTPFDFYDRLLPLAEKFDVAIAEEAHIPLLINCGYVDELLEYVKRHQTQRLGLCLDLGIFMRAPARWLEEMLLNPHGVDPAISTYIREAREDLLPEEEAIETVRAMGGNELAVNLAKMVYHLTYSSKEQNEVSELGKIAPIIRHCHAKFYDILDDLSDERSIPYSEIIPELARLGYDGYLSSEYEGMRDPFLASNQIRRQHYLMRKLWH